MVSPVVSFTNKKTSFELEHYTNAAMQEITDCTVDVSFEDFQYMVMDTANRVHDMTSDQKRVMIKMADHILQSLARDLAQWHCESCHLTDRCDTCPWETYEQTIVETLPSELYFDKTIR